jgi:hypothetical protein
VRGRASRAGRGNIPGVTWHVLAAIFALLMLARNAPRALRLGGPREERAGALLAVVNVVLAVGILAYAVKGLAARLISS